MAAIALRPLKDTKGLILRSFLYYTVDFDLRRENNLSIKDKLAGPNVSISKRFQSIWYSLSCSNRWGKVAPIKTRQTNSATCISTDTSADAWQTAHDHGGEVNLVSNKHYTATPCPQSPPPPQLMSTQRK